MTPLIHTGTRVAVGLCALLPVLASACGGSPAPATQTTAAAKVSNPKPEADLTSITLTPEAQTHLALKIETAVEGPVTAARTVGGDAIVPPGRAVTLTAPVAGTLSLPPGRSLSLQPVSQGDVLLELVPLQPSDRDSRTEAERSLREADARLTEATQRLSRLEQLLKDGSTSVRIVEEARATHAVAQAAVDAARVRVSSVSRGPSGTRGELALTAPVSGVITAIRAAAGQTVAAGTPVLDIADTASLWVRVPLYAGDLSSIDASRPAAVVTLGHESSGPWRDVARVSGPPVADPTASSVDLYFALPNPGSAIRPGERLAVRLPLKSSTSDRAIVVPRSAIVYDLNGGTWVYEAKDGHVFTRRRVEIADAGPSSVVVHRGLTAGVRIVTAGVAELYGTEFFVSK